MVVDWVSRSVWVDNAQYDTHGKENLAPIRKNYHTSHVANSPHPDTVNRRAKLELTNKSDIIRRALMAYLPPQEVAAIKQSISRDSTLKARKAE